MIMLTNIQKVYFLGIGGIGMSAIARYFLAQNMEVAGYDKTETDLTRNLEKEGISIIYDDNLALLPNWLSMPSSQTLVVYTPAIPKDLKIAHELKNRGFDIIKRSDALALITQNKTTLAVAGTHGKTTTSTYLAHILYNEKVNMAAFLGGISTNYNSNYITHSTVGNEIIVVEADEFDRSFLKLKPTVSIITSCEADHLDIYGTFENLKQAYNDFANCLVQGGTLILHESLKGFFDLRNDIKTIYYGENADVSIENIHIQNEKFNFNIKALNYNNLKNGLPGMHNILNATAAIIAANQLVQLENVHHSIISFKGIKRRFEVILQSEKHIYIDDYAHHPSEIAAAIATAKALYPSKQLTVVFQPHLFSRTKDLAEGFRKELSLADILLIMPIYPARELPMAGVTADMINPENRAIIADHNAVINYVKAQKPALLLTLGAGNIDLLVEPLKHFFETINASYEK